MTISRLLAAVCLSAVLSYYVATLSMAMPSVYVFWLICLALLAIDLAWVRTVAGGRVLALVLAGLAFLVVPATLIFHVHNSHSSEDTPWNTVASDLGSSSAKFQSYLARYGKCPVSAEELAGRSMIDAFSGRAYIFEERNDLCVMRSVGIDRVDNQMTHALKPENRALLAKGFPLRAVPLGWLFADSRCCDGDVWLACSKDGICKLSY